MFMSFDMKFIRGDQQTRMNGEAQHLNILTPAMNMCCFRYKTSLRLFGGNVLDHCGAYLEKLSAPRGKYIEYGIIIMPYTI